MKGIKRLVFAAIFTCVAAHGFAQNTPRSYVAFHSTEPMVIDGLADEKSWTNAPWSESYMDIEGALTPKYDTRMKMAWDEEYFYIYAEMEEPHVWADLKQRDTIIFYNNDFEIFIDPDGDTHNYYEFEMNALNTVWDLFLSKPYRNQGKVLGGWDCKGFRSAVHVRGSLNDASDEDKGWSIEVAIPWSIDTAPGGTAEVPVNRFWRVNFSRVNWDFDRIEGKYRRKKDSNGTYLPEYNWVWSPQGVINMHEPEHWGYVYFSAGESGSRSQFKIPKEEPIKWYLYELFREYAQSNVEPKDGWERKISNHRIAPKLSKNAYGWTIWVASPFTNQILSIQEDGKFERRAMEEK